MADWVTISSSLATGAGTLVLAVATFSSVRSANRSARVAELSLLTGLRPVLIPSRDEDPPQHVGFGDGVVLTIPGHGAARLEHEGRLYLGIALRNGGQGLGVLHGWQIPPLENPGTAGRPDPEGFRRQIRDLYIPAGDAGYWQGAIRERDDPDHERVRTAIARGERVLVDLMYGDHEGGQRTIVRFGITPWAEVEGERAEVLRYWNVDRADPR